MIYDENYHKWVASAFESMKHEPNNKEVKNAYESLKLEILIEYNRIMQKDYFVAYSDKVWSHKGLIDMIKTNKIIPVFPTSKGFGNDFDNYSDNPLLEKTRYKIGGESACYNDLLRAYHDYIGHYIGGYDFSKEGEEKAYRFHCKQLSKSAEKAFTVETRGQNSWVHFGPFANHNAKSKGAETIHAPQKVGLLPEWCSYQY